MVCGVCVCGVGCVCVCACVRACSRINEVASKSFYRLLVMFSWILMDLQNNASFLELCLVLLTWNTIAAFSEEHVAKLVYRVLLLYLVVSSALER